jgi:hypothetical protein
MAAWPVPPPPEARTGSHAPQGAADAWFGDFVAKAQSELPYCRKVGRYAFFAVCAWGFGLSVGALPYFMHMRDEALHSLASVASVSAFLILRDMSKTWDLAVFAAASAIDGRNGS